LGNTRNHSLRATGFRSRGEQWKNRDETVLNPSRKGPKISRERDQKKIRRFRIKLANKLCFQGNAAREGRTLTVHTEGRRRVLSRKINN